MLKSVSGKAWCLRERIRGRASVISQANRFFCSGSVKFGLKKDLYAEGCELKISYKPSSPGIGVLDIDTPSLVVDLDNLEHNLRSLKQVVNEVNPNVDIRPHAKAIKCPEIAHMQMQMGGAIGVCCAKLWEARSLMEGGINDIFITNEIIGRKKLENLAEIIMYNPDSIVSVCVDNKENVDEMAAVLGDYGVRAEVVVEVNVGQNRCGTKPGLDAVRLAEHVAKHKNLDFKGIQTYNGAIQFARELHDRRQLIDGVSRKVEETLDAFHSSGIEVPYVTGGGTGTFLIDLEMDVFTEIQPGSYVFMDTNYGQNFLDAENAKVLNEHLFHQSLFVLASVQSNSPKNFWAVVDAGMKAVSLDYDTPHVLLSKKDDKDSAYAPTPVYSSANIDDSIRYICGGDEHGILVSEKLEASYKNGDVEKGMDDCNTLRLKDLPLEEKIWLVPGHCDPTVNMYDHIVAIRDGAVMDTWAITGRGPGH
eukprot:Nk52_evm17s281 gene=Nk52_evmTU17s281